MICLDPSIREWLAGSDPKALEQADAARLALREALYPQAAEQHALASMVAGGEERGRSTVSSEIERSQAKMARLAAEAEQLAAEQQEIVGRELSLGAGATREQVQAARSRLAELRAQLELKQRQMQQAHDRVQDEIDRQTNALREVAHRQRAALDTVLEPIANLVARMGRASRRSACTSGVASRSSRSATGSAATRSSRS